MLELERLDPLAHPDLAKKAGHPARAAVCSGEHGQLCCRIEECSEQADVGSHISRH